MFLPSPRRLQAPLALALTLLVAACARLADQLVHGLRLLATIRAGLNIPGEVTRPVPPLSLAEVDSALSFIFGTAVTPKI